MTDVDRAIAFVHRQGTPVEQARLDYLLHGTLLSPAIAQQLFAGQRRDGGWPPFWQPEYSSLDATCLRLAQAEQLGLLTTEPVGKALSFLLERQGADGSWQEDRSVVAFAPPWAKPGDLAATLYLTANCCYWLFRSLGAQPAVSQAADFLLEHANDAGQMPTFAHGHWLAVGLWCGAGYHDAAERTMEHLDALLASLPSSNLAWLIVTVASTRISADH